MKKFFWSSVVLLGLLLLVGLALVATAQGQALEKREVVLAEPSRDTDRKDGYGFELRGEVYRAGAKKECAEMNLDGSLKTVYCPADQVGTYLVRVRSYNRETQEIIGTLAVRLGSARDIQLRFGRQIIWDPYFRYGTNPDTGEPLSYSYSARCIECNDFVTTEFTPTSPTAFTGKLTIYMPVTEQLRKEAPARNIK